MKSSEEILLSLLRNALWGTPCNLHSRPDWNEVLALASQQTVPGLVAEAISNIPVEFHPDAGQKLKLHSTVVRIYNSHSLLNGKIAQVKSLMDKNMIPTVLFKGQGVALNYPNPQSRQCGDIDLYVGEGNFLRAMNLLEPGVEHDENEYRHMKHFSIDSDGVHVELHRIAEILPGKKADKEFQKWTVDQLMGPDVRSVSIGGSLVNLPPVNFDALYIMNHAWHHFINGGIGLRQLCDWTLYLHKFHDQIDADVLERNLRRFGLTRAWQIMGGVAVNYLGLPSGECPLYTGSCNTLSGKVLSVIFSEGNFGRHSVIRKASQRPKGHFAGKWHSFRMTTRRISSIFSVSPGDVIKAWFWYFIKGMRNINKHVG